MILRLISVTKNIAAAKLTFRLQIDVSDIKKERN